MGGKEALDKTYHFITKQMVATGQAPHYTEIAAELGVSPEEGRQAMHKLFQSGLYGWLYPNTDFIVSFAPFNNQPTQFRVTVDGEQKWFAGHVFLQPLQTADGPGLLLAHENLFRRIVGARCQQR